MARLEERMTKESSDLREELRRSFDSLESFTKKEVESLADRLRVEQGERGESVQDLSRELHRLNESLEKKIRQLDEQSSRTQRDLRQQILDQSKSLADDIRQKYEMLSSALGQQVEDLRKDKTDRSALADLFTELAMRLNNEFKLPDPQ